MKSRYLNFLLITITTAIALLAGFYFFVLKPKLELPKKLLKAEETIAKNHFNLLQNRLGIVGLATLDPNSPNLSIQKANLLGEALETNKNGLDHLQEIPYVETLEDNTKISTQTLFNENRKILEEQRAYLNKIKEIDEINGNLYKYNPLTDLAKLDLYKDNDRSQIIERSYNAIEGIGKIEKNLSNHPEYENVNKLREEILNTQDLMKKQIQEIENGDYTAASLTFYDVYNKFALLRELGIGMEKAQITSPEAIKLITDQTNLLLKYEFMLKRINGLQEKLPETDLYSLF